MNKLVFLVYDARSGSTLLAAVLNQYSCFSVMPETNFATRMMAKGLGHFTSYNAANIFAFLSEEPHFEELNIKCEDFIAAYDSLIDGGCLQKTTQAVLQSYFGEFESDSTYVIKCGGAIFYLDELLSNVSGAVALHIIRDGRAVCSSKRNSISTWGRAINKNIVANARHWNHRMLAASQCRGVLVDVTYESLVRDMNDTLLKICECLAIDVDSLSLVREISSYSEIIGDRQKHLHTNIGFPDKNNIDKWVGQLTENEVRLYEGIAGKSLVEYGYGLISKRNGIVSLGYIFFVLRAYLKFYGKKIITFLLLLREGRAWARIKSKVRWARRSFSS